MARKKCLHPRFIRVTPFGEKKSRVMSVPCGKCIHCLHNHQRDWMFRLILENETSKKSAFVTLTLDDDHVSHGLDVKVLQDFIRVVRQRFVRERAFDVYDDSDNLSYYAVGEYGKTTNRPHYHIMFFHLPQLSNVELLKIFEHYWKKGFVYVQSCVPKTIGYVTKYITKYDWREHDVSPFCLIEQKSSFGIEVFYQESPCVESFEDIETSYMEVKKW